MKDSNNNSGIILSRNVPIAIVWGAASFLGSYICEELLRKKIQVLGADDLGTSDEKFLNECKENKNFYLIDITKISELNEETLPRIDYAFFTKLDDSGRGSYKHELLNFLKLVTGKEGKEEKVHARVHHLLTSKSKTAYISSIELYNQKTDDSLLHLKEGEIFFAKYAKEYKLNARVIRLASLYGPRMPFDESGKDPITRLIQAALLDKLQEEQTSLDFTSRAVYVKDAANLIIKAVLAGSTAQKIYDGALYTPIKVSEIKQVLLDPIWHEKTGFVPTPLPPWPTPNLKRTIKELNWRPSENIVSNLKETIHYFKENEVLVPELEREEREVFKGKNWSFYAQDMGDDLKREKKDDLLGESTEESASKGEEGEGEDRKKIRRIFTFDMSTLRNKLVIFLGIGIIVYGIFYPFVSIGVGAFLIREQVKNSGEYLAKGNFEQAKSEIGSAKRTLGEINHVLSWSRAAYELGVFPNQIEEISNIASITEEGIDGIEHAIEGTRSLFEVTKIISGEVSDDPGAYYDRAKVELEVASDKLAIAEQKLSKSDLVKYLPSTFERRADDLVLKLKYYREIVNKARAAAQLLPEITGVGGSKQYLILLQNNLELRPTGGFIGSYAKIIFEDGRIKEIKVDDIYNLDGNLKETVMPPTDLKTDLGQNNWYLRDSNTEPDFPTSAKQAEFFYTKEAGEKVHGVIGLDLTASGKLLSAVGGVDLPDYGEHVDGNNLFEKAISHAEVNFFPGSQAKRNYLTQLQMQLFNKLFFVSKQNWPSIINAIGESLEEKHLLVFVSDPIVFSYLSSQNWAGVLPRQSQEKVDGRNLDFLAISESNMGANKSNYYLKRKINLETSLGKEGQIFQNLKILYTNTSPSEVFPSGKYKNRIKIYTPLGSKLIRANYNQTDITNNVTTFSDYGRTGFSVLIEVLPKEEKVFNIEYELGSPLSFKEDIGEYRIDIIKQPGTDKDSLEWNFTYPINYLIESQSENLLNSPQEINISTDLQKDRSFQVILRQNR